VKVNKKNLAPSIFVILFSGFIYSTSVNISQCIAAAQTNNQDAQNFIKDLGKQAIAILSSQGSGRMEEFRQLFKSNFDLETVERHALHNNWNKATDAQRAEYVKAFEDDIVNTYFNLLSTYYKQDAKGGKQDELEIGKTEKKGKKTYVHSNIVRTNGQKIPLRWELYTSGGNFKILDVTVESASTSNAKTQEYRGMIRESGGEISKFITSLKKKVKEMHNK
jgi:phospholipid transport system substrate-binding protein